MKSNKNVQFLVLLACIGTISNMHILASRSDSESFRRDREASRSSDSGDLNNSQTDIQKNADQNIYEKEWHLYLRNLIISSATTQSITKLTMDELKITGNDFLNSPLLPEDSFPIKVSLFHLAVQCRHQKLCNFFLDELKVNINAIGRGGMTALHYAAADDSTYEPVYENNGRLIHHGTNATNIREIFTAFLLEKGASPSMKTKRGHAPFDLIQGQPRGPMIKRCEELRALLDPTKKRSSAVCAAPQEHHSSENIKTQQISTLFDSCFGTDSYRDI